MSDEQPNTTIRDVIRDTLWRLYGYREDLVGVHPMVLRKFDEDAEAVLETIEQAGYALVERNPIPEERSRFLSDPEEFSELIEAELGYVLVDRERWERVVECASAWEAGDSVDGYDCSFSDRVQRASAALLPGDLDPIGDNNE